MKDWQYNQNIEYHTRYNNQSCNDFLHSRHTDGNIFKGIDMTLINIL